MKYTALIGSLLLSSTSFAQNTGIGTTSPTDQLHTTGTVRLEGYRGFGNRMMEIDSSGRLAISPASPVFTASPNAFVPDGGPGAGCAVGNGLTSTINISGMPASVSSSKIAVRLSILHPNDADLRLLLVSPGGAVLTLASGNGGNGQDFTGTIFADAATQNISAGTAPFTGTYQPAGLTSTQCLINPTVATFSAIGGGTINPNGIWTLKIFDAAAGNTGGLYYWSITFGGPQSFATADNDTHIAKFSGGAMAPSSIREDPASGGIGIGGSPGSSSYKLEVSGDMYCADMTTGNISSSVINNVSMITTTTLAANQVNSTSLFNSGAVSAGSLSATGSTSLGSPLIISAGSPAAGKVLTAGNTSGNASWANLPGYNTGFRTLSSTASTTVANAATVTIPFNTSNGYSFDDGGNFNAATHIYTAPSAGIYQFNVSVAIGSGNAVANGYLQLGCSANGSGQNLPIVKATTVAGDPLPATMTVSFLTKLNSGETIYATVYNNSGGSISFISGVSTQFSGMRIF